ncbi:MAG: universal stress protein [Armatimonadetes bacterium]|nr:universal stress protein [Armatimonadota bacterium]
MEKHDIVVALSNPDNVAKLMRLGCMMANEFDGTVVAATVVTIQDNPVFDEQHRDRMTRAYNLLEAAEETAKEWCARFDTRLATCRGIDDIVDELAKVRQAKAIIMGYSERDHPIEGREYDRLIDDVAAHVPCNLIVARFNNDGMNYRRVLVPVAQRLNMDVRRDLVIALRHQADAQVDMVHFTTSEEEAAAMKEELRQWLVERGVSDWVTPRVDIHDDPREAIVAASRGYDAVILGTLPLHALRRRLFGSVPEYVAENVRCTALLVRQHEG